MRLLYFVIPVVLASAPTGAPKVEAPIDGAPAAAPADPRAAAELMIHLPHAAQALVGAGVPEADVAVVLTAAESAGVSAADAGVIVQAAETQVKEHGPIDNFGAFVQSQLATGARGKALADAIAAEHAARGKGGKAPETPPGKAKAEGADKSAAGEGKSHGKEKQEAAGGKAGQGAGKNRGNESAGKSGDEAATSGGKGAGGKKEEQGKGKNRRTEDAR
jgi:hypothetical protein